ncbi:MAG: hypothetical protein OXF01_12400, partial [Gemmatimonadetes bacterium]|nr:hypothetical protein [Gemmatimonadota bacterium]
ATTDDSSDESDETFTLTLSSPANATLGTATATGTIVDDDNELTASFGGMPASHTGEPFTFQLTFSEAPHSLGYQTLRDHAFDVTGGAVQEAGRRQQGSDQAWNITVEPASSNDAVTITLPATTDCNASGAICTEDSRPLSNSESATVAGPVILPAVSVSGASATEGDTVEFTVSLSVASSEQVTVEYATSGGTAVSGTDFTAESGTLTFAANETSKTVSVATTDDSSDESDETFTLTLSSPANATLGMATATGTIVDDDDAPTTQLTASFGGMPASHTGARFTFQLTFSEAPHSLGYQKLRDDAFDVTGGTVHAAGRRQQGSDQAWNITVAPSGQGDVMITLPATTDCSASGAICTEDKRPLSNSESATVAGPATPPAVSVSGASATEGDAVEFTVSLSAATSQQVTVAYATSGGTAASGTDFTAESGTLTFAANETSKTVSVATTDDSSDESDETFTLTLSSPANATLGTATATGTIVDDDEQLTASFGGMPASHTGEPFTFQLTFSEEPHSVGYRKLRDDAFDVSGGSVQKAKRRTSGSNQDWNITVEPTSANDTVTITLPETTNCNASGAICTEDGRKLSHSLTDTVLDAASATSGDAANGVVEDDALDDALALADGVTPDEAAAALFGERVFSEARLAALDRLGNRNGRYDLGDMLSWIERCRQGEVRCGGSSTDPGPASSAALLGAAAAGRRNRPGRHDSESRRGSPKRARRRRVRMAGYVLAVLLAATSCTDDSLGPTAGVADPGFLTIEWTGPATSNDTGVLLELEGPGIDTVRAPGLELYRTSVSERHQIVVAGSLGQGPLVQFRVPDRRQPSLYRVRVLQVTGEDYRLMDPREYEAVIMPN